MPLPTTITTAELCRATGYSKAAITAFEQAGTIRRDAVNEWPFDTILKVITHLRERRSVVSDDRSRWEKAKAEARSFAYGASVTTSSNCPTSRKESMRWPMWCSSTWRRCRRGALVVAIWQSASVLRPSCGLPSRQCLMR